MDELWKKHYNEGGKKRAMKMYDQEKTHSGSCLNIPLLERLYHIKKVRGVKLILFTNRRRVKYSDTMEALQEWRYIFDDMIFCDGKKVEKNIEGYFIDNERKYIECCKEDDHFIKVETFQCKMKK